MHTNAGGRLKVLDLIETERLFSGRLNDGIGERMFAALVEAGGEP